jgi:hypothetical protein
MKQLPDKFAINSRNKGNPIWKEYIKWLNAPERGNKWWAGADVATFYGVNGREQHGGTDCGSSVGSFEREITLEEWKEATSSSIVPEYTIY